MKPPLIIGDLNGPDGNAFVILGRAQYVAKEYDLDWDTIQKEATSGDYDNLLTVIKKYFEVYREVISYEKI